MGREAERTGMQKVKRIEEDFSVAADLRVCSLAAPAGSCCLCAEAQPEFTLRGQTTAASEG
jgi:hypothetical protein